MQKEIISGVYRKRAPSGVCLRGKNACVSVYMRNEERRRHGHAKMADGKNMLER